MARQQGLGEGHPRGGVSLSDEGTRSRSRSRGSGGARGRAPRSSRSRGCASVRLSDEGTRSRSR
eukprot:9998367-Lingulodinium_polyedra.AAC.1